MPNLDLTFNMVLELLRLVCYMLNAITPQIVVSMSHLSLSQYNVTVKCGSFATEDHMLHVNETSVSTQACDIVKLMVFITSSTYLYTDLITLLRLICGYLGSNVLMKAMKLDRSPRWRGRFSHAYIFARFFAHSLNPGFLAPIACCIAE